ncbi:hypothetical protein BSKO_13215 [Bryopsis sp. KO-2023]|nr:hypothetical protein BSKO_13215 [Bryopsis sp. KO-2023]
MLKLCTVASAVIALGVCLQQLDQGRRRRRREREAEAQECAERDSRVGSEEAGSEENDRPGEDKEIQELPAPNTPTTSTILAHRSAPHFFLNHFRIPVETFLYLVPGRWSWLATSGEVRVVTCPDTGTHFYEKKVFYDERFPTMVARLKLELFVSLVVSVSSPFLLPCCAFRDFSYVYLISEFCPGGPLDTYFPEAQNTTIETCRFFAAELLLALCTLHERHLALRNLSFGSTLVSEGGHVLIWDFSRIVDTRTWEGPNSSHPGYLAHPNASLFLAPEVAHNHAAAGLAGDVWSYGVVVYRMLVGQFPFPNLGEDTRCFDPWFVDSVWRVSGVLDTSPHYGRFTINHVI